MIVDRRIDWKAVLLVAIAMIFLYITHKRLDNETLTFIYYYILLPTTIIFSIYKLLPRR